MLKQFLQVAASLALLNGCGSVTNNQIDGAPKVILGDPLFTNDAPKLVSYREIELTHQPSAPPYPQIARDSGTQGEVLVEVWIDEKGVPTRSASLLGPQELRQTAANYALGWRFKPYRFGGQAIPVRFRLPMPFRLIVGQPGPFQRLPKGLTY